MPQIAQHRRQLVWATLVVIVGATGLIVSFISVVVALAGLPERSSTVLLFDVPPGAIGMALSTLLIVTGTAFWARDTPQVGRAPETRARASAALSVTVLLLGIIGWTAAFALTADKVVTLIEPDAQLGCNVSLLVQCGANLESWQGSVFGFPNPLLGLVGWSAVIVVAVLLLARVRLQAWFWITFNVGVAGALAFVIWLVGQSIFVLGTLCPWCLVTWAVTIPLFWMTTLGNAHHSRFGTTAQTILGAAYSWTPLITVASYLAVALIAQFRLDLLMYL